MLNEILHFDNRPHKIEERISAAGTKGHIVIPGFKYIEEEMQYDDFTYEDIGRLASYIC